MRRMDDLHALAHGYLDAALEPTRWPVVLARTARHFSAVGVDLHLMRHGASWASYMGGTPAEVLTEYTERFINREPRSLTLQHLRPGLVVTDLDFVDRETMRTHEYYADFLRRGGMGHCIAATPWRNGRNQAYLGVHFPYGQEPPEAECMAFVRALQPYVARAAQAQFRLAEAELRSILYSEVLDRVGTGVIVLDASYRILLENAPGRVALDDKRCFRTHNLRIEPVDTREAAHFERLCKTAVERREDAGGAMLIQGGLGTPCYSVLVHPVDEALRDCTGATAFVFVSALGQGAPADTMSRLRELFRLTPAEARLAAAMLGGAALRAIATSQGITYESARFTLRQIYAKLGVHKQGELVALLGQAIGAWRR